MGEGTSDKGQDRGQGTRDDKGQATRDKEKREVGRYVRVLTMAAMVASSYPSSASTSRVCSPSSGARRPAIGGVADIFTGAPSARVGPRRGGSGFPTISRARDWGGGENSAGL